MVEARKVVKFVRVAADVAWAMSGLSRLLSCYFNAWHQGLLSIQQPASSPNSAESISLNWSCYLGKHGTVGHHGTKSLYLMSAYWMWWSLIDVWTLNLLVTWTSKGHIWWMRLMVIYIYLCVSCQLIWLGMLTFMSGTQVIVNVNAMMASHDMVKHRWGGHWYENIIHAYTTVLVKLFLHWCNKLWCCYLELL